MAIQKKNKQHKQISQTNNILLSSLSNKINKFLYDYHKLKQKICFAFTFIKGNSDCNSQS
jgi:hypothetical protein